MLLKGISSVSRQPAETPSRAMLHMVARLHYEQDVSQVDISRRLGVSSATISRLLQRARAEGIVRIEVRPLHEPEAVGEELALALGLRHCHVIEALPAGEIAALAPLIDDLLARAGLVAGSVLAIGWGRAVRAVVEAGLAPLPGVSVVPATGGMQQHAPHFQVNEFVRLAALATGGVPHFVHAPYLPGRESRMAFLSDPAIADSVALWDRIDAAVVGIGLPHAANAPEASAATPPEQALVEAAGDVIRHYFDANGRLVSWDGETRMIAATPAQLRAAGLVIGVAVGAEKAGAIIGAARARFVSALVTDAATAAAVLDRLGKSL
jgi:DNA-binding transcriptional regulator LsrR (DeoR family)